MGTMDRSNPTGVKFLVFDIETRIDKDLLREVEGLPGEDDGEATYARVRAERRDRFGTDFIPFAYHVPVSIGIGKVGEDLVLRSVQVLRADEDGEDGIVRRWWEGLSRFGAGGWLVSFNGRGFDLPVLELRALRAGLSIPDYFRENGLRARRSRHLDLYDYLSNYGAARPRGGLNLLCRLIGLPGKDAVSGGDVQSLWEAGRYDEVHRYCRADVIRTYLLFLHVERLRGNVDTTRLHEIEAATEEFRREIEAVESQNPLAGPDG